MQKCILGCLEEKQLCLQCLDSLQVVGKPNNAKANRIVSYSDNETVDQRRLVQEVFSAMFAYPSKKGNKVPLYAYFDRDEDTEKCR